MPPRASSMPQPWPAVSPDQTNEIERRSAGAVRKRPVIGSPTMVGDDKVLEADAVEDVLPGGQALDQRVGGEIGFRQRIDEDGAVDGLEAVGGRDLGQHPRRPVGARPDHAGVERDVAGLDAMGDERAIGGAAEIRLGDAAGGGDRGRGRGGSEKPTPRQGMRTIIEFLQFEE